MMRRTQAAFLLSAERLFAQGKPIYFWTFTWYDVHLDREYAALWSGFVKAMNYALGYRTGSGAFQGLRVVEPHKMHGLHYHALLNRRLSVDEVRSVGARFGIGRVHVKLCEDVGIARYMAKYLTKARMSGTRVRVWGGVGGFKCCRGVDVEIGSLYHEVWAALVEPGQRVAWWVRRYVLDLCRQYGALYLWGPRRRIAAAQFLVDNGVLLTLACLRSLRSFSTLCGVELSEKMQKQLTLKGIVDYESKAY